MGFYPAQVLCKSVTYLLQPPLKIEAESVSLAYSSRNRACASLETWFTLEKLNSMPQLLIKHITVLTYYCAGPKNIQIKQSGEAENLLVEL